MKTMWTSWEAQTQFLLTWAPMLSLQLLRQVCQ